MNEKDTWTWVCGFGIILGVAWLYRKESATRYRQQYGCYQPQASNYAAGTSDSYPAPGYS